MRLGDDVRENAVGLRGAAARARWLRGFAGLYFDGVDGRGMKVAGLVCFSGEVVRVGFG